ncbi:MAG: hypothetical protein ABII76_27255 [Pseudomonadota bacterium]
MNDEPKDQRIPIMMSASEVKAIDDWSFEHRVRTRAEAVRRLCQIGLHYDGDVIENADDALLDAATEGIRALEWVKEAMDKGNIEGIDNLFKSLLLTFSKLIEAETSLSRMTMKGVYLTETPDIAEALHSVEGMMARLKAVRDRHQGKNDPARRRAGGA